MELTGIDIPQEIVQTIIEYLPFPSARRVCRSMEESSSMSWSREIEKVRSKSPWLSYRDAQNNLIVSRGGTPIIYPDTWTSSDWALVGPFAITFAIIIHVAVYMTISYILG